MLHRIKDLNHFITTSPTPLRLTRVVLFLTGVFTAVQLSGVFAAAAGVTLTATPNSRTIYAGQSTTYTININRDNYVGKVTLGASNLPADVVVTFSPNPATGATSVMTVTTTPATPTGNFKLKISGSASGVSIAAINVTLVVQKRVKLSVLPGSESIIAGQGASIEVTLARTNYEGPVILAAKSLPAGVSVVFDDNPVNGLKTTMRIYSHGVPHVWKEEFFNIEASARNIEGPFDRLPFVLRVNCGITWVDHFGSDQIDQRHIELNDDGDIVIDGRNGDVTVDANGYIYVAGSTFGTVDPQNPNQGGRDVFLAKYDGAGQQLWIRQFGSSEEDRPTEVVVDSAGRIFLGGFTLGTLPGNSPQGNVDFWIAKYDSDGNRNFLKQDGTSGQDGRFGLIIVPDGSGGGKLVTFRNERSRVTSYTFNLAGNLTFQSEALQPFDNPYDIALGPNDSLYTVGSFVNNSGYLNEYIIKFDNQGNEVWRNTFGDAYPRVATRIVVDSAGNAYVSGRRIPFPPAIPNSRAWIAKYDGVDGSLVWEKYEPSPLFQIWYDVINAIGIDSHGDVIIAGYTEGVVGERNGDGNQEKDDAWVSRRSSSTGDLIWVKQFPVQDLDGFDAMAFDNYEGIILSGYTTNFKSNLGFEDALLLRYVDSSNGLQVNLRPYITAFNPASSIAGVPINIEGGNFFSITGVRFNGLAARYTVPSSARINATVPFGASTGTVTIIQGCSSYHSPQPFTVLP